MLGVRCGFNCSDLCLYCLFWDKGCFIILDASCKCEWRHLQVPFLPRLTAALGSNTLSIVSVDSQSKACWCVCSCNAWACWLSSLQGRCLRWRSLLTISLVSMHREMLRLWAESRIRFSKSMVEAQRRWTTFGQLWMIKTGRTTFGRMFGQWPILRVTISEVSEWQRPHCLASYIFDFQDTFNQNLWNASAVWPGFASPWNFALHMNALNALHMNVLDILAKQSCDSCAGGQGFLGQELCRCLWCQFDEFVLQTWVSIPCCSMLFPRFGRYLLRKGELTNSAGEKQTIQRTLTDCLPKPQGMIGPRALPAGLSFLTTCHQQAKMVWMLIPRCEFPEVLTFDLCNMGMQTQICRS